MMSSRADMLSILETLDDEVFPPEAARLTRGHSHGPKKVILPHGWIESRDDHTPPGVLASAFSSGG